MHVGQRLNLEIINKWLETDLPRFILIEGQKGSGRLTLAKKIAEIHNKKAVISDNSVEAVRNVIESSYTTTEEIIYIFVDTDNMSPQAKNALLKVTEEPPNNAIFIMTVQNLQNMLSTIISRATVLKMLPYRKEDLEKLTKDENLLEYCETPADIEYWSENDIMDIIKFCEKVVNNIANVTGVNALKIGSYLKYKEDGKGYDPLFFVNTICKICSKRYISGELDIPSIAFSTLYATCSKAKHNLQLTKLKKESIIDYFLLDLRSILSNEL